MSRRRTRGWSDITVTDQFCGAGGSSIGATAAGLRLRMALNHWDLAVETHNTNFPDADHDCCDISAADPRRYPSTDILITSPECTTHSPAGGNRRTTRPGNRFVPAGEDPATRRSRATMRDVPRFAEYHRYRRIVVENVVEVVRWPLFAHWLKEMELLGYRWKLVSSNSMFSWPTPQSRDRLYIVFWRKGDRAPDMALEPPAPCMRCLAVVEAVQTWKPRAVARAIDGQAYGKYRTQYVYTCPQCHHEVTPFYFAALNVIDFTIPAVRVGDREAAGLDPLAPRTLERIAYGLAKYGRRHLIVNVRQGERDSSRAWPADLRPIGSVPTWDGYFGLSSPFVVGAANTGHAYGRRTMGLDESLTTVHAGGGNHALVDPGFVFNVAGRDARAPLGGAMPTQESREKFALCFLAALRGGGSHRKNDARELGMPIGTVTADGNHFALIGPGFAPFIDVTRSNTMPRGIEDPLAPMTTTQHHVLIQGAAQISLRHSGAERVAGLEAEMRSQVGAQQQGLIQSAPFITSQYSGGGQHSVIDGPFPTTPGAEVHELVTPSTKLKPEDCYFRMLQDTEIGRAMAFPETYKVLGNKGERIKQYGNAVTPPVMATLITRQVQALTGERAA